MFSVFPFARENRPLEGACQGSKWILNQEAVLTRRKRTVFQVRDCQTRRQMKRGNHLKKGQKRTKQSPKQTCRLRRNRITSCMNTYNTTMPPIKWKEHARRVKPEGRSCNMVSRGSASKAKHRKASQHIVLIQTVQQQKRQSN